jgi:hypothetical protein
MKMEITPGSIIVGASGKKLRVDAIEGDTIYSGQLKILTSAVVRVIPQRPNHPPATEYKVGDRVEYIGSDFYFKKQYAGVLEVWEISPIDGYTCLKPNGRATSWIEFADLQLIIEVTPSMEDDLWA